uniref:FAD synthase n=1 Tax=Hyalomma excavatum TaxID=257692 RepID=A0A131XLF0_9ACAR
MTLRSAGLFPRFFLRIRRAMSSGNDTAGIIVIGDEILRGDIRDTNVYHICSRLRAVGIRVERVSIIPDVVPVIAEEVRKFSASYSYVFTSGGVGPTHDDVTYESVAAAFDEDVFVHPEVLESFQALYGPRSGAEIAISKFATIPRSSRILFGDIQRPGRVLRLPLVCAKNVYMLPGVPLALEALFPLFLKDCEEKGHKIMYITELFIKSDELSITATLNKAVEKFKNKVKFGSYPSLDSNYYRVRLVLEGEKEEDVAEAKTFLLNNLPDDSVTKFDRDPLTNAWQKLSTLAERKPHVAAALQIIEEAVAKYTLEGICVGFSGGKDCTVILHMLYALLQKQLKPGETALPKVQCLFMRSEHMWPDTISFIQNSAKLYNCELTTITEGSYKVALQHYLASKPNVKAFLLGNRSTDPGGDKLKPFTPTDEGWPQVMRVFPVLDWSYKDVWDFIRDLSIPYCSLYDQGYSSIGENEEPNEVLMYFDSRGAKRFKPAYMLEDVKLERCGRK